MKIFENEGQIITNGDDLRELEAAIQLATAKFTGTDKLGGFPLISGSQVSAALSSYYRTLEQFLTVEDEQSYNIVAKELARCQSRLRKAIDELDAHVERLTMGLEKAKQVAGRLEEFASYNI